MNRYSHDNWNQVWNLPCGPDRDKQLKFVGHLAKGNLHWFVRKLIGGISQDELLWIHGKITSGEMLPKSNFLRYMKRLHENSLS